MASLRTFVALELEAAAIGQLTGVQAELQTLLHSMLGRGANALKPTRSHQMHMTLAFLGDTPMTSLDRIVAILKDVSARHASITMPAERVCYLRSSACATAVVISFNDESKRGAALARDLRESLAPAGFEFERRSFMAHVTLLRSRKGLRVPLDVPHVLRNELGKVVLELHRIVYFASFLEATGARYERLWAASLGTGPW
ncbi:MAG TPA: RNA 2',3'-cyclic phosphodiesterase [Polyangiaceae bacterium]